MTFASTKELIETLQPLICTENLRITTENTIWRGHTCQSDLVTLNEAHNIHLEVFENEIIIGYFTDHTHFEDYTCDLANGEAPYLERAKEFLIKLYTLPIRHLQIFRGTKLLCEKYYFVSPCSDDEWIGGTWYGLVRWFCPFAKKRSTTNCWQYDPSRKDFTIRQPKHINPEAIAEITIDEDCYIEIFEKTGIYIYQIWHITYDNYNGMYFWEMLDDKTASFFNTQEKAVLAAQETLRRIGYTSLQTTSLDACE